MAFLKQAHIRHMHLIPEFFWDLPVLYRHRRRKVEARLRVPRIHLEYDIFFYDFELDFGDEKELKSHVSFNDQTLISLDKPSVRPWELSKAFVTLDWLKERKVRLEAIRDEIKDSYKNYNARQKEEISQSLNVGDLNLQDLVTQTTTISPF